MASSIIDAMMSGPNAMLSGARRAGVKADTAATQIQSQMLQEQEGRLAQKQQDDEIQHALAQGAKYVGPGQMIQEQMVAPDGSTVTTHRPPNDDEYIATYHGRKGTPPVKLAWGPLHQQILNQVQAKAPERAAAVQQAGDVSKAEATGTAAGQTAGRISDLAARGTPVSAQEAEMFKIPQGSLLTPEMRAQYHERYFTVDRANVMQTGMMNRTDAQQAGAMDRATLRAKTQSDIAESKQQLEDELSQRRLDYQNRWANARNAIASNTQGSLNNRALLRQFDSNQSQHGKLLDQTYKESQKQLEAGALLDPQNGIGNGEEFTDPWSGKKMTMNVAQRLRIGNALRSSQQQVGALQDRAGQIEQRFGVNATPSGAGATPPSGGAPVGPGGAPASRPQAKVASKAQVQAYATKKGISVDQAAQEFKASKYTIQ